MRDDRVDRAQLRFWSLSDRENRVSIEKDAVFPDDAPVGLSGQNEMVIGRLAERILEARSADRPVMLAFGAHAIKNGLGPVLAHLIEEEVVTHLATNGAGIIHDWELSYLGRTSEHVERNARRGRFGAWEETGRYLNLALLLGAFRGLGYGASVGAMIEEEHLEIPEPGWLRDQIRNELAAPVVSEVLPAAGDLLSVLETSDLEPGRVDLPHRFAEYSVQAAAYREDVPFTGHPMFGHDIIYLHPLNCGAAIGRAAERDFLSFAETVSRLDGGVYVSMGSAVMSPMVFEKSMSMAQNIASREGRTITDHMIVVNDIQESTWDWSRGEPPEDHPDYYLRFFKTFHRMGGELHYACCDNRDFMLGLCRELSGGGS
ncbi:MAG: hypothetical protein ACOCTQ_00505 [Planctomycetota bacterium]